MTSLIVYPVIIVVALALLIVLFARALRDAQDQEAAQHIQGHVPNAQRKQGRAETFFARIQEKTHSVATRLKRKAHKQQIKAALEEAQIEKAEKESVQTEEKVTHVPQASDTHTPDDVQPVTQAEQSPADSGQKLSRMGEIILSYHKNAIDGSSGEVFDEREIALVQAVEENPKSAEAYENLGDYYMERQRFDDARECYKYVLRVDPRHKKAQDAMRKLDRVLSVG